MTTSGTYSFSLDFGGLTREAWERCQLLAESMPGWMLRSARISINLMLLDWAARGINLWAVERVDFGPLYAGQQTVGTNAGTLDILEATISSTSPVSDERVMSDLSRDEYVAYPNKLQTGRPSMVWVERILPVPILHLFPIPDNSAVYHLVYYRLRLMQDVSAAAQTVDIPPIFHEALCAGLAARIAQKWVKDNDLRAELRSLAQEAFSAASMQDTERVNLSLAPDMTGWGF